MSNELLVAAIGLFFGFFSGFTGYSSTGVLLAGLSLFSLVKDYETTVGTILYALLFPLSIFAVMYHYKNNSIDFHVGNILIVSIIIGICAGTIAISTFTPSNFEKISRYFTAILSFIVGTYFLTSAYKLK